MASDEIEWAERKAPGTDGAGLVDEISLKNFMCHSELILSDLSSRKILFITGPNGSGKSAILTSLMLGFGGRAQITCRGHSTKGFVKEGKPHAEVQIKLKNDTSFGRFQPEKFGNAIFVKRKLTHSGSSEYTLSNERGIPVYKTAAALKKLMSFFDIHVENPLMLLTQENAKKLLFDATEKEMYNFFRTGTGLDLIHLRMTNCRKEIERVRNQWTIRQSAHERRKGDLDKLKKRYNRYKEVENFQLRESELQQSLQWVDLAQKEKDLIKIRADADRIGKQCQEIERKKEEAHRAIEENQTRVAEHAQVVQDAAAEIDRAKHEMHAVQARRNETLSDLKKVEIDMQSRQRKLQQLNSQRNDIVRAMEAANRKLQAKRGADAERQRNEAKLADYRQQKLKIEEELLKENSDREEAQRKVNELRTSCQQLADELNSADRDLKRLRAKREDYERIQSNSISRFGRHMPAIMREIDIAAQQGLFRKPPVGPLGRYISIKNDETWAPAIEQAIGKHYATFICSCIDDKNTLHNILRGKVKLSPASPEYPTIVHTDRLGARRFDVSKNQASCPGSDLVTFFDIAEITDDDAYNFLIELSSIESKLFAPDSQAALNLVNAGQCQRLKEVLAKNCDRILYWAATKASNFYANQYPVRANYLMKSVEREMADAQSKEHEFEMKIRELAPRSHAANKATASAVQALNSIEARAKELSNRLRSLDFNIEHLTRSLSTALDEPNDANLLEEDLQRKDDEINEYKSSQEQQVLDARLKAARDELKKIDQLIENARVLVQQKEEAHEEAQGRAASVHRQAADYRRKLPGLREQFEKISEQWNNQKLLVDQAELEVKSSLETLVKKFGERPRLRNSETRRDIEAALADLREKIADRERIDKTGFESIPERQKSIETEQQELHEKDEQLRALEVIIHRRIEGYPALINRTAVNIEKWFARMSYSKELNNQLKFDHTSGTLSFRVNSGPTAQKQRRMTTSGASISSSQTSIAPKQAQTPQAATSRSIKTLSGGERSMSTVFFLLSLWEQSESPVKGMDEFDVFLDGENRAAVLSLITTYTPKQSGQFFLLSPCNVTSLGNPHNSTIIALKKGGGLSRGDVPHSASQNISEPVSRKRTSASRLSSSQTSMSTQKPDEESDDEVMPNRKSKSRRKQCKLEATQEVSDEDSD